MTARTCALLALAIVLGIAAIVAVIEGVEQHQRNAYCTGMGEVWQDRVELPDGSIMPGQCVDPGATV